MHLFKKFKELADKRKEVLDEDIEVLFAEEVLRVPDVYKLDYLNVVSGTRLVPTAMVKLTINGQEAQSAGFGNGPIDAAYNTIAKMTSTRSKLMRFTINSASGGTDALGEVTVRLKENGLVALGKGADPDIITASVKAYVNGTKVAEEELKGLSKMTRVGVFGGDYEITPSDFRFKYFKVLPNVACK